MLKTQKRMFGWCLGIFLTLALAACTIPVPAVEEAAPSEEAAAGALQPEFAAVPGIVDPTNGGWPREAEGLNGIVSIDQKPERIITASIGHDEMTVALVPLERLVAVGAVSKDATFSNVAEMLADKPEISRDPETIIAMDPDVIVTSPFFPAEGVEALQRVGIATLQTALQHDAQARLNDILLLGYIYGEEARAIEFAKEVQERHETLQAVTAAKAPKPSVLVITRYSDQIWAAGQGSTEGSVIEAAGGVNAAAVAGIEYNQTISLESVIVMAPDTIVIAQPLAYGAEEFLQDLLAEETLAEVPAIQSGDVHIVDSKLFTTLSFWNIRGAEELARILWPDDFADVPVQPFSEVE